MKQVWKQFDREKLFFCYECSRCTGSCPAAMVMKTPGPRRILIKCLHAGPEAVAREESLWYCTTCHVCEDRCPQEIHVAELMMSLMNVAAAKGNIPEKVRGVVEMITKTGRAVITYRADEERERFGLAPLRSIDLGEIETIARRTGLNERFRP